MFLDFHVSTLALRPTSFKQTLSEIAPLNWFTAVRGGKEIIMVSNMNYEYNEIKSENPFKEMWNYLFLFMQTDFTIDQIIKNNPTIDKLELHSNLTKQANQIKLSIKQAYEYFEASKTVSIVTKPLLLYYGFIALSRALILLKQDGNYSYDKMRKNKTHNHHGLNLKKEFANSNSTSITDFLKDIKCEINFNQKEPWGNFPIFYKTLNSDPLVMNGKKYFEGSNIQAECRIIFDSCPKKDILNKSSSFDVYNLLLHLPDMYDYLKTKRMHPLLNFGNFTMSSTKKIGIRTNGMVVNHGVTIDEFSIIIEGLEEESHKKWFEVYYKEKGIIFNDINSSVIKTNFSRTVKDDESKKLIYFPDAVSSIAEQIYFIRNSDEYITESASHFIILFMLSMICRYYPDIWINKIEKLDGFAELILYFLDISCRKFPNLILNQMSNTKYIFK